MKYQICCDNEAAFRRTLDDIHQEKPFAAFEVVARYWCSSELLGITIMVEYQVTTNTAAGSEEEDDEPDWFIAYLVKDESDDRCDKEIYTETVEDHITYETVKTEMENFAERVFSVYEMLRSAKGA